MYDEPNPGQHRVAGVAKLSRMWYPAGRCCDEDAKARFGLFYLDSVEPQVSKATRKVREPSLAKHGEGREGSTTRDLKTELSTTNPPLP